MYIHLRDAIIGNVDTTPAINNIGTANILPSSYIGSPRHMQEYITTPWLTYVHADDQIFLSHLCVIQNWDEIKNLLLSGQTSMHRLDITHVSSNIIKIFEEFD